MAKIGFGQIRNDYSLKDMKPNDTQLYVFLILHARNHTPTVQNGIHIAVGQWLACRSKLSIETGLSESQVRTSLQNLEKHGYIKKDVVRIPNKKQQRMTLITVIGHGTFGQEDNQRINQRNENNLANELTNETKVKTIENQSDSGNALDNISQRIDQRTSTEFSNDSTIYTDRQYTDSIYTEVNTNSNKHQEVPSGNVTEKIESYISNLGFNLSEAQGEGGGTAWINSLLKQGFKPYDIIYIAYMTHKKLKKTEGHIAYAMRIAENHRKGSKPDRMYYDIKEKWESGKI